MRRQFVSNVAFYSTTAVLILIIVLCIGAVSYTHLTLPTTERV